MKPYFNCHSHTMYSNLRLLDCINRPIDLIDKAIELGLSGIAITDHESLSSHVLVNKYMQKIKETHPDFKIALGNEIYLVEDATPGQKYFHFILIAKDAMGHKALRELSTAAWSRVFTDRRMERVPTLKSELKSILAKYKGSVIGTSACIGGELPYLALKMQAAQNAGQQDEAKKYYNEIIDFVTFCQDVFGDDFYIECAPGYSEEQIAANKKLSGIAKKFNIKLVVGTDAHYLRPENRPVHTAYLTSKSGDREVEGFYDYTYLMTSEEIHEHMSSSFSAEEIDTILDNTLDIQNKISNYSLFNKQSIPSTRVPVTEKVLNWDSNYPTLTKLLSSDDVQDRYWATECLTALKDRDLYNSTYISALEEEARVQSVIGEKLETNMFKYPNTLQHYIDLIWDCNSMVGAGRGSACAALNHYLMGITQLDPIKWELPFFRYLNDERVELGDIDIDICPSARPLVIQKIKEERQQMLDSSLSQWSKENLGCTLVATFGTEGTKSAIQTACRGYRSEDYPNGIDIDEAQYLSSLIPQERGFLWSINDVVYGNEEKNRRPVTTFINKIAEYPGLLDIVVAIAGLVNHRGSHAAGVIFFEDDPYDNCAFMKTPSGDLTTQFDLHDSEWMGMTKYDFLVTDVQDKFVQAIELLQENGEIEQDLSLREVYNKYFHPDVLPVDDEKAWDALANGDVINTFQFDAAVGMQAAQSLKPRSIIEMVAANGLMRLMGEEGAERPVDKYARQKADISIWYKEMDDEGLTKQQQTDIEPYFKADYGVPPTQEMLMLMLMDKNICNFSLAEANAARKIVGKKQMDKIPWLRDKIMNQAPTRELGAYIWKHGVGPQMGYAFSVIHALAYSYIGFQTLYIATHWNSIYWNTACLICNTGARDPENGGSTNYGKTAKALGEIIADGITIHLADINKSMYGFLPDAKNNAILFGLKGMLGVGDEMIARIIENRPYTSVEDFIQKVSPTKTAMISLIKGGAFDSFKDRVELMKGYLMTTCDAKTKLNLQNMPVLVSGGYIPQEYGKEISVYEFNRYLKSVCKYSSEFYKLDERAINFLNRIGADDLITTDDSGTIVLPAKQWDKKVYQVHMDVIRQWLSKNQASILTQLNAGLFEAEWNKYAQGTVSSWEMEVLCFYYHEHELAHINLEKYGISRFSDLPEEPVVEKTFTARNGKEVSMFKLEKICGTCIAKDSVKSTIALLTTSGVVSVKFRKEHYALFDKQISVKCSDGTKKVVESSWFNRGEMLVVQGIRSGNSFIPKKYSSTAGHQLYHITDIVGTDIVITSSRAQGDDMF